LAYLLQELYLTAGPGQVATRQAYQALGGVAGALARQADAVFAELRVHTDAEVILSTLLRLVAMDGAEPTRRRVPVDELSADEHRIVQFFIDARLLTTDAAGDQPYVQVAHEALFRQWAPLRQEVSTRSEHLKRRTELDRWAADWVKSRRSPDYLLTGERLELAGQWLEAMTSAGQDSPSGRALVEASRSRDTAFLHRVSESIGQYALLNVDRVPELAVLLTAAALSECPPTPIARRALMAALAFSHIEAVLAGHSDAVRTVAWSPDGQQVATASRDGSARIWHVDSATVTGLLRGHTDMVEALAWSPDSSQIATGSRDTTIRVWDVNTAAEIAILACDDFVRGVAWSPDGSILAGTSRDRTVRLWQTGDWLRRSTLEGHSGDIWGVTWSPDSTRLATASHDRAVIIWDVTTGDPVLHLRGHRDFVEAVAWSPDGQWIATGSGDHTARIWNAENGTQHTVVGNYRDPVWSIAWTPDGDQLALATGGGSIHVWDVALMQDVAELRGHEQTIWSVAMSPDGQRILSGSGDTTARIWTLYPRGAETALLAGHRGPITALAVSNNGSIATGAADRSLRRWQSNGSPDGEPAMLSAPAAALAYSPTGDVLAMALQDGTVHLWFPDGEELELADGLEYESIVFSPDGTRLAAGGKNNAIQLWDLRTRAPRGTLTGHTDWIGALSWSPSGRYLASGSDDRTARIWDIENPANTPLLSGHQNYIDGICWAPDEQSVATCSADWTIRVWNLNDGVATRVHSGHERRVRAVAWSGDGQYLASASDDRTVRIWDPHSDAQPQIIGVHRDAVTSVAWLPGDEHVVTGSADGTARIWSVRVDVDGLTAAARTRVFRTLTAEERHAHLLPAGP
jgi:WD40 repeat protein